MRKKREVLVSGFAALLGGNKEKETLAAKVRRQGLLEFVNRCQKAPYPEGRSCDYSGSDGDIGEGTGTGAGKALPEKERLGLAEARKKGIGRNPQLESIDTNPPKYGGAAPVYDERITWREGGVDALTDAELDMIAAKYQDRGRDWGIVEDENGRVLDPDPSKTAHDLYRLHQAGLGDQVGLIKDLVKNAKPVTVEQWKSNKPGVKNSPLFVYAVPGTKSFLMAVAINPKTGKVLTAYAVKPDGTAVLRRKDARPLVDEWLKETTGVGVKGELLYVE